MHVSHTPHPNPHLPNVHVQTIITTPSARGTHRGQFSHYSKYYVILSLEHHIHTFISIGLEGYIQVSYIYTHRFHDLPFLFSTLPPSSNTMKHAQSLLVISEVVVENWSKQNRERSSVQQDEPQLGG
jgi:hypothetical protein